MKRLLIKWLGGYAPDEINSVRLKLCQRFTVTENYAYIECDRMLFEMGVRDALLKNSKE